MKKLRPSLTSIFMIRSIEEPAEEGETLAGG